MVKFIVLILGFLAYASFDVKHTFAADVYDARCTEAKNETIVAGNVTSIITSMDSCDTSKNLACNNGRCACKDPNKHVYTTREFKRSELPSYLIPLIPQSRSKRSPGKGGKPKGSKSRGVGTGTAIAGGVVAGVAGYQLGKAVSGSSGSSSNGNSGSKSKVKIQSCYARIQSDCAIDPDKKQSITKTTIETDASGNTTKIIKDEIVDYSNWPLCIEKAICRRKTNVTAGADANIGECVCQDGYARNTQDLCSKSNGVIILSSFSSVFGMSIAFVICQFFQQKIFL